MNAKYSKGVAVLVGLVLAGSVGVIPQRAEAALPTTEAPMELYPNQPGPAVLGAGSPLLTYQADASLPIKVYRQWFLLGPKISVRSAFQGELRFTQDGSRPTPVSRRYLGSFVHARRTPIRIGVFAGTNLVTEAVAFPTHEMLAQPPDWRLPRSHRQPTARTTLSTLAATDQAVLIEVNREVLRQPGSNPMPPLPPTNLTQPEDASRIIAPPPPPVAPESTASEVLVEVSREVLRHPGSNPMPPLPPTNLTQPEEYTRIISPPTVVGP